MIVLFCLPVSKDQYAEWDCRGYSSIYCWTSKVCRELRHSNFISFVDRNFPTTDNINKKLKSDEERQERGDILETRQFGFVFMINLFDNKILWFLDEWKRKKPFQIVILKYVRCSNTFDRVHQYLLIYFRLNLQHQLSQQHWPIIIPRMQLY